MLQALQYGDEVTYGGSIVPVLDWRGFPGTSEWRVPGEVECSKVKQMGLTTFVGGLGDGDGAAGGIILHGSSPNAGAGVAVSVYDQKSGDFSASAESSTALRSRRMSVLLPGAAVMLVHGLQLEGRQEQDVLTGAGKASSADEYPVVTTLTQQSLLPKSPPHPQGDDYMPQVGLASKGGSPSGPLTGNLTYEGSDVQWVSHDGSVFVPLSLLDQDEPAGAKSPGSSQPSFGAAQSVTIESGNRWGDWQRSSTPQSPARVQRGVFQAQLSHGNWSAAGPSAGRNEAAPASFAWVQRIAGTGAKDAGKVTQDTQDAIRAVSYANGTVLAVSASLAASGGLPAGGMLALSVWPDAPIGQAVPASAFPVPDGAPISGIAEVPAPGVYLIRWNNTGATNEKAVQITAADPLQAPTPKPIALKIRAANPPSAGHAVPLQLVGGVPLAVYSSDEQHGIASSKAGVTCSVQEQDVLTATVQLPSGMSFEGASVTGTCSL